MTTSALPSPQIRITLVSLILIAIFAACSDSPTTAKEVIPQDIVELILPNLEHARVDLAPAIADPAVRVTVSQNISILEAGVRGSDGHAVRVALTDLARIVRTYEAASGNAGRPDGPDVSALVLELALVERNVNAGFARKRN